MGKRNTALINREKEASRIARENDQIAMRMHDNSHTRPFLTVNTQFDELRQLPHSCAVNRQRETSRIERENVKLAALWRSRRGTSWRRRGPKRRRGPEAFRLGGPVVLEGDCYRPQSRGGVRSRRTTLGK